ncbi:MAG: hypothetical protein JXX14_23995 [Deltaproteobacteria bacterium]|nr:hypothetical protein [Deltaproteobacteria bacterium]
MEAVSDFEDMLMLLHKHEVKYLIIGGLAFIFHAKPRYTKDMDIWLAYYSENIQRANAALAEFGSPASVSDSDQSEVLQLGIAPNRLDFFLRIEGMDFDSAWASRVTESYGRAPANWIGIDALLQIKSGIDKPKHQEDARVLLEVKKMQK